MESDNNPFRSFGEQSFILPSPLALIGTYHTVSLENTIKKPNIMAATWFTLCSAQPAALTVAIRETCLTHTSILNTKGFTLSIPSTNMITHVDFAGMSSGTQDDKFEILKLTPKAGDHVDAPYVAECPVVMELSLIQHHKIGTHSLFIGEIMDVKIKENCINKNGIPSPELMNIACYIPLLREYWSLGSFQAKAFSVGKTIPRTQT